MPLFPATGPLIRFCPIHNIALVQERLLGATGNSVANYYRCPVDHVLYEDRPITSEPTSYNL